SAFVPSSRTVVPLTVTRPSRINCSDARRDAIPACDRIFCSRSTVATIMPHPVIAIDGPSGAGKGTVARAVANRLGFRHVDSGAMYRAVAWKSLAGQVPLEDEGAVAQVAERSTITV